MSARIETISPRRKGSPRFDLKPVVEALRQSREVTHNIRHEGKVRELPSPAVIREVLDQLFTALFPTHLGPQGLKHDSIDLFVSNTLATTLTRLSDQIARGLLFNAEGLSSLEAQRAAEAIVHRIAHELPSIRAVLVDDLKAAHQQDPEAESLGEVLLCDRALAATFHRRVADVLNRHGARLVARIIERLAEGEPGIGAQFTARQL
jgi:serine O-acetyltransferase